MCTFHTCSFFFYQLWTLTYDFCVLLYQYLSFSVQVSFLQFLENIYLVFVMEFAFIHFMSFLRCIFHLVTILSFIVYTEMLWIQLKDFISGFVTPKIFNDTAQLIYAVVSRFTIYKIFQTLKGNYLISYCRKLTLITKIL